MSDVRPFNARSLVLSVLLGLPDGRLPTPALLRLGELFDIAPGTIRTALSRMSSAGELSSTDAGYELTGRLLERKAAQDIGRKPPASPWDGTWWIVAVTASSRTISDRREFRTRMVNARMGELRPDTWLRPANIGAPLLDVHSVAVRGELSGRGQPEVVAQLWDLSVLSARCRTLQARLVRGLEVLANDDISALPAGMLLSADVVRFLREEPFLPAELAPSDWPVDGLRDEYRRFDRHFGHLLATAISSSPVSS